MSYKPLELPRPPDFGYIGGLAVPNSSPRIAAPQEPDAAFEQMQNAIPVAEDLPDLVRVQYGKGDAQIVGALLKQANGEDSGLVGVPSTLAVRLLQSWGYPTTMDAWDAATWEQTIGTNAQPNPLQMLGY